jgi:hypothetical protein
VQVEFDELRRDKLLIKLSWLNSEPEVRVEREAPPPLDSVDEQQVSSQRSGPRGDRSVLKDLAGRRARAGATWARGCPLGTRGE